MLNGPTPSSGVPSRPRFALELVGDAVRQIPIECRRGIPHTLIMTMPILLEEEHLQALPGPRLTHAPELLRRLTASEDPRERRRVLGEALERAGFQWLGYGRIRSTGTTHFLRSHAHPEWTQRYFSEGWESIDLRMACRRPDHLPRGWSTADVQARVSSVNASPAQHAFAQHLRHCGIGGGMLFRFPSLAGNDECAVLSLSSASDARHVGEALGRCLLLAWCVHAFYERHSRVRCATDGCADWRTRMDVLRALAQGRSNKQIAASLGLSIHSVEHHVRVLRRRFGAVNRVALAQAVACRGGLSGEG